MKMKKIVLLFSLIAVLFSMTGCSDGQEKVSFEYTEVSIVSDALYQAYSIQNVSDAYRALYADSEEEMAETLLTGISNFDTLAEECGEFEGYRTKDGSCATVDFNSLLNAADQESYDLAYAEYVSLIDQINAKIEEDGSDVVVELPVVYSNRDAIYTFRYEENPAYAYSEEVSGQRTTPYQVKEISAAPDYSLGEKMEKAAYNTLMGMGTVFIVLIFIAFVIAQFEKINKASVAIGNWWSNRKNKKKENETVETASTPVTTAPASVATANPMDDSQLVAVITAAVVAANTATGGTDKLIVRSIRKAKR